jgi:acetyl-CoA acetyltransferase
MGSVWIAGSYQSDFARNFAREGLEISDLVAEAVKGTLTSAGLEPEDVESIHVGNAFGQLFTGQGQPYVFPHVRQVVTDAFRRAEIPGVGALDGIETHDCFSMSEYMAIDHFGITEPGESWKAVENGELERDGAIPVNPSGGLIGVGHPVGATGVRMLHDAARQVTGQAGECQVEGARTFATLNIGGSLTTTVSFVVTRGD